MFSKNTLTNTALRLATVLTSLLLFCSVQAAIIDKGITTYDSTTGLEWLDLPPTLGYSFFGIDEELATGGLFSGYRRAKHNEVLELFYNMNLYPNTDEVTDPALGDVPVNDEHRRFIALFGTTSHTPGFGRHALGYAEDENGYNLVMGLDAINWASIPQYVLYRGDNSISHNPNKVFLGTGTFLVRNDRVNRVPEINAQTAPAAFGLLIAALLIIVERRSRGRDIRAL